MENDFELEPGCEETPELREQELRQDMLQESEEFLEPEEKPVFDFKYTLSEQEYIDFNVFSSMSKSKVFSNLMALSILKASSENLFFGEPTHLISLFSKSSSPPK